MLICLAWPRLSVDISILATKHTCWCKSGHNLLGYGQPSNYPLHPPTRKPNVNPGRSTARDTALLSPRRRSGIFPFVALLESASAIGVYMVCICWRTVLRLDSDAKDLLFVLKIVMGLVHRAFVASSSRKRNACQFMQNATESNNAYLIVADSISPIF